ncbi:hypothetical protein GCM10023321_50150 [Pseudonocardia eucalypti]|uniref:OmpR/PhoB-type domain-containing protein n=1 Tax=Pseudonocardia eucalypti TaxID=648755 RepID=A0ABP9QKU6_9PSEU
MRSSREELRYRVLGEVEVHAAHGPLELGSPKQRSVLAVLLLDANKVVSDERLINMVWGDRLPRSARGRLQVYVSELRSVLGRDVIGRHGQGYRISVTPGMLDFQVFVDTVGRARDELRAGDAPAAVRLLRDGLRLWAGIPLSGVSGTLAARLRPVLVDRRLDALEELYEAELAAGHHALVVDELRDVVAAQPHRERLAAQLMRALNRGEGRSEALVGYGNARAGLVPELGTEAGLCWRETQLRVLTDQGAEAEAVEASGVSPTQQVQVVPADLPRIMSGFTGRADELAALDLSLLSDSGIVVISGDGGTGKTALAVQWGHRMRERFRDGQLYLDLRGFGPDNQSMSSAEALGRLLRRLGVPPTEVPDSIDARAALYRSLLAGRRVLVLLDNARDAAQVHPLLPASGSVVVTSRHRLAELVARWDARPLLLKGRDGVEARTALGVVLDQSA